MMLVEQLLVLLLGLFVSSLADYGTGSENMGEIISSLENISEILFNNGYNSWGNTIRKAIVLLKEQEAKTGKWIPIESPTGVQAFGVKEMTVMDVRCSVCGSEEDVSFTGYKYCPRCGARMKGR